MSPCCTTCCAGDDGACAAPAFGVPPPGAPLLGGTGGGPVTGGSPALEEGGRFWGMMIDERTHKVHSQKPSELPQTKRFANEAEVGEVGSLVVVVGKYARSFDSANSTS
jgi:hypothetical protein